MTERITVKGQEYDFQSPATDETIRGIAELNAAANGEGAGALCRALDSGYGRMKREHWYALLEPGSGRVLSTVCLIPTAWTVACPGASATIRAAELGLVATAEDARGRGLSTWLIGRFLADARAQGFPLSTIEGIPYYYRRFGFEYAVPLAIQLRLGPGLSPWRDEYAAMPTPAGSQASKSSAAQGTVNEYRKELPAYRPASLDDLPLLAAWYAEACADLSVRSDRDGALWRYLLGPARASPETVVDRFVVMDRAGRPAGYLGVQEDGFGPALGLAEASLPSDFGTGPTATDFLAIADALRAERGKRNLTVALHREHPAHAAALALGGRERWIYAWQVATMDAPALLAALRPVLEARLASSAFAGTPYAMKLSLYGAGLLLDWDGKRLAAGAVEADELEEGGPRLPPELLAPLALGYRTVAELRHCRHDVSVYGRDQDFLDAAFPRVASFVYPLY